MDDDAILQEELYPQRNWFHKFTRFIGCIVSLSTLLMGSAQFVGIAYQAETAIQYVVHIYVLLLCFLALLTELEWTSMVTDSKILHNWVTRGIFYALIGTLGLLQDETEELRSVNAFTSRDVAMKFIYGVAWLMIACGLLYFCMGLLCLQRLVRRFRENHAARLEMASEKRKLMKKRKKTIPSLPESSADDDVV